MPAAPRPIFRADAVRRHLQGREASVLPRFVSPRSLVCLWLLLGLLAAGLFLTWLAPVPVIVSGTAVVVAGTAGALPSRDAAVLVAFLPPQSLPHLRPGQRVWLAAGPARERWSRRVLAVEPAISSPEAARRRFGGAAGAIRGPAAVIIARWPPLQDHLPAAAYLGSIYHADVETGRRRLISFLPLAGRLGEE